MCAYLRNLHALLGQVDENGWSFFLPEVPRLAQDLDFVVLLYNLHVLVLVVCARLALTLIDGLCLRIKNKFKI